MKLKKKIARSLPWVGMLAAAGAAVYYRIEAEDARGELDFRTDPNSIQVHPKLMREVRDGATLMYKVDKKGEHFTTTGEFPLDEV